MQGRRQGEASFTAATRSVFTEWETDFGVATDGWPEGACLCAWTPATVTSATSRWWCGRRTAQARPSSCTLLRPGRPTTSGAVMTCTKAKTVAMTRSLEVSSTARPTGTGRSRFMVYDGRRVVLAEQTWIPLRPTPPERTSSVTLPSCTGRPRSIPSGATNTGRRSGARPLPGARDARHQHGVHGRERLSAGSGLPSRPAPPTARSSVIRPMSSKTRCIPPIPRWPPPTTGCRRLPTRSPR